MNRIVIFFVATLLLTIGCGKSDNGSDTPTPPSTPSVETKMTTDMLLGTWQVQEVEYTDGKKLSGYPTEAQNCIKKSQFIFSKTTLTDISHTYDIDEKNCEEEQGTLLYTLEGNSLFLTVESEKVHYGTVTIKDNTLSVTFSKEIQQNAGTRTIAYKKVSNNTEAPAEKKATATVSASGNIDNTISVAIAERSFLTGGSVLILEEESFVQGKAFLDVKKYIGKELYFILKNKSTRENVSDEVKKLITEGDNAVSLVYNAKVYTANITVNQNNAPLANQKVYAMTATEFNSFKTIAAVASRNFTTFEQTVESTFKTKSITNSQGVAIFENLKPQFSNLSQYTFVVLAKTAPYYKSVELNMDGTAQSGTILLSESAQGGTTNGKTSVRFWLSGEKGEIILDATVQINGKTGYTNTNGMVMFDDMPENTNLEYTITTKKCKKITKGVHRTGKANTTTTVHLNTIDPEEGKMVIKNNSSNPYTVKIGSRSWVLEGKDSIILNGELNTEYTVSWKQNSGYLIYPTTGSKNIAFTCQERVINVSFP